MAVDKFEANIPYPPGVVTAWRGATTDIPSGWIICDGNNQSPNLQNRYPKSVPNTSTDPGTVAGSHSTTLTTSQLPSHSHSGSVDSQAKHSHGISAGDTASNWEGSVATPVNSYNGTTTSDGYHSHTGTTSSTGGNSSINNEPPYKTVIFIQKL